MSKAYIRFWQEADVDFIKKHLLIAGDLSGDCANCKQMGIDFKTATTCPNCKTDFNYIASRSLSAISDHGSLVHRIRQVRPDLVFIDFADFRHITEKNKAQDFFD